MKVLVSTFRLNNVVLLRVDSLNAFASVNSLYKSTSSTEELTCINVAYGPTGIQLQLLNGVECNKRPINNS